MAKKKKTTKKKRRVPLWSKLQDWHKLMITIAATAAVVVYGGELLGYVKDTCASIDKRWTHNEIFVAKTAELEENIQLVGIRLEQKIKQDQIDWRNKRISELLSQFGSFEKMPEWARSEFLRLQNEIKIIREGKKFTF